MRVQRFERLEIQPLTVFRSMASLSSIAHYGLKSKLVPSTSANFRLPSQASKFRKNESITVKSSHEFSTRSRFSLYTAVGTSQRHGFVEPLVLRRSNKSTSATRPASNIHRKHENLVCRAGVAQLDKYGQCKCIEDAVTSIMKDTIQHCLNKENDVMRDKVLDQMGKGLAALCRVSVGVAAESSNAPIPIVSIVPELSTIKDEDLEQVRRMLQLTSLPFHTTDDEDFKRLTKMLQKSGNGQDSDKRTLSGSELSQICERLGSDLVQCLGPMVMCFPELPLWAKHRALLLPAEVAGKLALSLLAK